MIDQEVLTRDMKDLIIDWNNKITVLLNNNIHPIDKATANTLISCMTSLQATLVQNGIYINPNE